MENAALAAAVVILTLIFREGLPAVMKLFDARHAQSRETIAAEAQARKDAAAEERNRERERAAELLRQSEETIELQRADLLDGRNQIHDLRNELGIFSNRLTVSEVKHAVCETKLKWVMEWIASNKDAFERAGISYPKLSPEQKPPAEGADYRE